MRYAYVKFQERILIIVRDIDLFPVIFYFFLCRGKIIHHMISYKVIDTTHYLFNCIIAA